MHRASARDSHEFFGLDDDGKEDTESLWGHGRSTSSVDCGELGWLSSFWCICVVFDATVALDPQFKTAIKSIGKGSVDPSVDLFCVVADREVPADDQIVFELVFAFDKVIEMHMAIFVDAIFSMIRR